MCVYTIYIYIHIYVIPDVAGKNGEDAERRCELRGRAMCLERQATRQRFSEQVLAVLFYPGEYDRAPNRIHFSV